MFKLCNQLRTPDAITGSQPHAYQDCDTTYRNQIKPEYLIFKNKNVALTGVVLKKNRLYFQVICYPGQKYLLEGKHTAIEKVRITTHQAITIAKLSTTSSNLH